MGFTSAAKQPQFGALAQQAGVRWTKEGFSWHQMELSPGVYTFSNQDTFINNAVAANLQIMVEIGLTPQFYSSNPSSPSFFLYPPTSNSGLNAWANYVTACVNRYKDRVHHWQIWANLDDPAIWPLAPGGVTEYFNLLERAYNAIKAADPTATVIIASVDPAVLNALLDMGAASFFDAIAVHNYAEPFAPEVSPLTVLRLATLRDVSQRRAGAKPLYVSEFGWPSAPGAPTGVSEGFQAAYLIRSNLIQGAYAAVPATFWTDFQDQPVGGSYDPNQPEDNFGMLLKIDDSKKFAYDAHKAMTTALAGGQLVGPRFPTKAGIEFQEGFETARTYSIFFAGGATGSHTRTPAVAHTGNASMRIDYSLTAAANTTVALAPDPSFFLPVPGTPKRLRVWARGNGGPAPELTVGFGDANGEIFEAIVGLVSGTDWREYTYYLDAVPGTSVLAVGNQDNVIQYPIQFTGFAVHIWTVASPVTTGTLWVDDITFESGPTVIDQEYARPGEVVHALWALDGTYSVTIPTVAPSVTYRDWTNTAFTFFPSNGKVTVPIGVNPAMVTIPAASPTFSDVAFTDTFWSYIEALFRSGVTGGCAFSPPRYCPGSSVTRGHMAVFLVRSKYGTAYTPPAPTGIFADVPTNHAFAAFIEKLYSDGVTTGCAMSPLRYCPDGSVTRGQMAAFLLKSEHGSAYVPPAPTGIFADVPTNHLFAAYIERLYAEGITGGCATNPLHYCPSSSVPRGQMAVFLTRTFRFARP